jgi:signal transduction histidine kinase
MTGLPWTVVAGGEHGSSSGSEARNVLLLGSLGLLVILLGGGAGFVWRAFSLEKNLSRRQSDFIAAVSHEFRTPLTSLRQFNSILMEDSEPPPDKRRKFHEAQSRATERLHRLVESLLDFGRMEAGRHPYQFECVELGALVAVAVEEIRLDAGGRGITVDWRQSGSPVLAMADREALPRALWNLADNAMKYSNGTPRIAIELELDAESAVLRVRDWGSGIPASEINHIFEKFYRGRQATQASIKGTGIGLAMVRHIVEAHGGRISVESQPGEGSTFSIHLPVAEQRP